MKRRNTEREKEVKLIAFFLVEKEEERANKRKKLKRI